MFSTWRAIGEKQGGTSPPFLRSSFSDSPLSSPSFCHRHHFVITIILSSPSFCHHRYFVITIILSSPSLWSLSLWSPSLSSLLWQLLVLCRAWVRDRGVREGFPVWLSREEALLSTGVLNLLSLDFSHSMWPIWYIRLTTWTQLGVRKFAQNLKSPPLPWHDRATTAQTASGTITRTVPGWLSLNRRVDLVILFWLCCLEECARGSFMGLASWIGRMGHSHSWY